MPKTKHHAIAATALAMVANQYGVPAKRAATSQARTLPTAYQLALRAAGDADNWWGAQGSRPSSPINLTAGPVPEAGKAAYGWYRTGHVDVDPTYLNYVNRVLQNPQNSRGGKINALVNLWHLMAHERGHNIGYAHQPSGLMAEDMGAVPGQAYDWARSIMGRPDKKK